MKATNLNKRATKSLCSFALLSTLGLATSSAYATTLYFDYNRNTLGGNERASVFLFGDAGQSATVSNLAGFNQNVILNADGFFNLDIPTTYMQGGTGITNTGFRIDSAESLAGYFVNRADASTDMTYLFEESSLGNDYVVASQNAGFGEGAQITIHATENNTAVTLNPIGGAPVNVVLNEGETYTYNASANLTGSRVTTDKPVAVFSGHECAQVPGGVTYCDTLVEQMIPVDRLSSSYLLTASEGASIAPRGYDLVRVIATEDNTQVTVGGVVVATINSGQFHEFQLPADSGEFVETSAPSLVAQYLIGGQGAATDPAMSVVPGIDTWLDSYRLATPSGNQAFNINYASVVLATADLASLMLDGVLVDTSSFSAIAGTMFSQGIVNLPLGLFDLTAASEFLVMLGGGSNADSYFTFGGSTFAPGISPVDPTTPSIPEPAGLALFGLGLVTLRRFMKVR